LALPAEGLIFASILLYPDLFKQLIEKAAKQQLNTDFKKSYFQGYQAEKWSTILEHPLFSEEVEEDFLNFVDPEKDEMEFVDVKNKVYSIFLERSSVLFS